jgi:recombination protein RecT
MTTAIQTAEKAKVFRSFLENPAVLQELAKALPPGLSAQRLVRQALTLVQNNPQLLECTHLSLLSGIMQAAELGLELTGGLGHAYLVPRNDKRLRAKVAAFQPGWKGLVKLALQSGTISSFPVRTVYERDEFDLEFGTANKITHRPARGGRGRPVGYYAAVLYKDGGADFEYMTREECESHRDKYSQSGDYSPWATAFDEMSQKTVVRRLCRRLSLCPEAQRVASLDEADEHQHRFQGARTAHVAALVAEQAAPLLLDGAPGADAGEPHVPEDSDERGGV